MRFQSNKSWWTLAAFLILPALALSIAAEQSNSLIITGQQGSAKVIQVDGRNYVEVEGLARLTSSSISFNGSQIVLTSSGAGTGGATLAAPSPGFSKDFINAGIEAMAQIREWQAALKNGIDQGYPLTGDSLSAYRAQAQQSLRTASLAVNTNSDKNALPFLTNEFNNMGKLSDKYVHMALTRTYIPPGSLDTDPLNQRIRGCAHSLASMATANQFIDDGSCQ
jgi:hypothetical protein